MTCDDAFQGVRRVFLDTAPAIYAVESDPLRSPRTWNALRHWIKNQIELVLGPITVAECLAGIRNPSGLQYMTEFLLGTRELEVRPIGDVVAVNAGRLRRETSLKLPDALQVSQAVEEGCNCILSNDADLARKQSAIRVILIDELGDK